MDKQSFYGNKEVQTTRTDNRCFMSQYFELYNCFWRSWCYLIAIQLRMKLIKVRSLFRKIKDSIYFMISFSLTEQNILWLFELERHFQSYRSNLDPTGVDPE